MRFDELTAEEEGGLRRWRGRGNAANERPLKVAPSFRSDRWTATKRLKRLPSIRTVADEGWLERLSKRPKIIDKQTRTNSV